MEDVLFAVWAIAIKEGEGSLDEDTKGLTNNLKNKVVALQVKEFPKIRQAYCSLAATKLLENNIYISTEGSKDDILILTGSFFADNYNIKEIQKILTVILTQFRFKEVRYRLNNSADNIISYNLASPEDRELTVQSR